MPAGLDIRPEATVYVGDTVDDMAAARGAGMWAVGVAPPYVDSEAHQVLLWERGAHTVIQDPNALLNLLRVPQA